MNKMRKMLTIVLSLLLLFSFCACGSAGIKDISGSQAKASALQAGFGRENITPSVPVAMGGYSDGETRKTNMVLDYIYTTCVAFNEGDTTVLVFTIDLCGMSDEQMDKIREHITAYTNIPNENIYIGITHTHSAPAYGALDSWDKEFLDGCAKAAQAAIADLAPITLQATTAILENMNFVRHYLMNDGTYYGSNFGSMESGFKAHALEYPDRQLILLKLDREEKKDILMINWQSHPSYAARQDDYTGVSADFIGHTRMKLENETGLMVAYYTGASGNTAVNSLIETENINNNNSYRAYGKTLADKIIQILPNLQTMEASGIQMTRFSFDAQIDHSWDHMIKQADEVFELWKNVGKTEGDNLAKTYGFTSSYQARAIRTRYSMDATVARELRAFRIGPIGFTTGTYEMYSDHAEYVKENSPFDITFVITGCSGYIGNKASYDYRSYETDTGMFVAGTGEKMAEKYVELLNSIK